MPLFNANNYMFLNIFFSSKCNVGTISSISKLEDEEKQEIILSKLQGVTFSTIIVHL